MSQGYIKLHRQIKECELWNDNEPYDRRSAWIDLLLMVNHADKRMIFENKLITVKKGQTVTSILKLSERWKWNRKKTKKFLSLLESAEMVTTESTTHGTTITIVNWDKYQLSGTTEVTTTRTTKGTTEGQPRPINNNDKECKKNDKKNKYADDDELNRAILDFIDHRRKLRKPMTDKAVKLFIDRLNRLAESPQHQVTLINEAISRGWQTVYPVDGQSEQQALNKQKSKNRLKDLEKYYLQKVGDE